jgi:hypothetical protein
MENEIKEKLYIGQIDYQSKHDSDVYTNYILELDEKGKPNLQEDEMFIVPKFTNLYIKLYTNSYKDLKLTTLNSLGKSTTLERFTEPCITYFITKLTTPGPLKLTLSNEDNNLSVFYILVEPKAYINDTEVSIDGIQIQTVLSKSLGKVRQWESHYKECEFLKYNFIHFTPIQELGSSDSLYSIRNQIAINPHFFDDEALGEAERFNLFKNAVKDYKKKYNVGGFVDIVLNHTAINSDWLYKNPDSGYNLFNTPHLNVAYEMDKILLEYSKRYAEKRVSCKGAPFIYNDSDLNELIGELSNIISKQNYEEFFMISLDKYIPHFEDFYNEYKKDMIGFLEKRQFVLTKLKENNKSQYNENDVYQIFYDSCINYGAKRFGVELENLEFTCLILLKEEYLKKQSLIEYIADLKKYFNKVNSAWITKAKEMIAKAIENTKAFIKYEFITLGRHKVTELKKLVENYFIRFEDNNPQAIFACNGWLFGVNDPTINFAIYPSWNYFTRSIIIWGDCAKLRYGERAEDSPYLWKHMTKYVQDMAAVFDGFRLDNAHSTPIHVAEYLMAQARIVNPDLIIMAELFAGTKERELGFVNRIGINIMIREAIYCTNTDELDEKLYRYGSGGKNTVLGALDPRVKRYVARKDSLGEFVDALDYYLLTPITPKSIIYDITHDNPTLHERYNNLALNLTFLATISMTMSSIGSTRGFDQLFPYQPSVIKENRLYKYNSTQLEDTDDIEVEFVLKRSGVNSVKLALSSNNWKPSVVLSRIGSDTWQTKLVLKRDTYYYKYVINDTQWIYDPEAENVGDGNGNINNILRLTKSSDMRIVRRMFNIIRQDCSSKHCQFYLHKDRDLLAMFKLFEDYSADYSGYALICRTGYDMSSKVEKYKIELPGEIQEVLLQARIKINDFDINIIRSDKFLTGVDSILEYSTSGKNISGTNLTKL